MSMPTYATIQPSREQWRKAIEQVNLKYTTAAEIENAAVEIAMREFRPRTDDRDAAANPLLHAQV